MIRLVPLRFIRLLAPVLLALGLATGCDELNSDEDPSQAKAESKTTTAAASTSKATTTSSASTDDGDDGSDSKYIVASVSGTWYFKNEIMKLKQSGSSIQGTTEVIGFVNSSSDPVQVPVPTVGGMTDEGTVRLDELLIYTKNPSKNFRIKKVGGLTAANTLTLKVTAGQKPHTQTWVRR